MRKLQQLRGFALALSGAQEDVLELVPSERARFESLGWAVLSTSCMAVISMWFALSSALGINGILAVPVALFWGLVIMGIDRWLITSMPVDGGRKVAMAVPRLLLALLLGTLISTPLVLRVFQSEINAQMALMQQQNYSSFLSGQHSSQVNQQVTTYSNELQQLNTVINSRGAQTGSSAADPELVAYNKQLTELQGELGHWTTLKSQYYTDYTCQLYGGAQCPKKGDGPAAKTSYQNYQQASRQVASYQGQIGHVQSEIQQRDQFLSSTSKSSQQQRYAEALNQRPIVQGEYNTAVQRKNQLQASYYAQEKASHGILMRLEALSALSGQSSTVAGARLLLFLLFLVIECLPVTVKLLQRPGQYEAALREAKEAERRDFKKAFAVRSRLVPAGSPAGPRPAVLRLRPEQEQEPGAEPIWNRTRVLPVPAGESADVRPTEIFNGPRPGARRPPEPGPPGDAPRRPRRWRGTDEYRNLWTGRDPETGPQRMTRRERPAADRYQEQTRLDAAPVPAGADVWGSTAATRVDYPPPPGEIPAARPADGNGSGIPLNWDDE